MAMSSADIERVLGEITPAVKGGWIQKISQPTPRSLVLDIRVPGHTHRLLMSCQAETARLHFLTRPLMNPPSPPAFCQFLRAHMQGARIDDLVQVPHDRIVRLMVTTQRGPRQIVCELTGSKANILALDADETVLRSLSGARDVIGRPYATPPSRQAMPQVQPVHRFVGPAQASFPLSAAIEAHYHDQEDQLAFNAGREARRRALQKALKKDQRRIEAWREDLQKALRYRHYARYGELIKAHLGSIDKGMDRVTLVDYYDDALPEVTIPLDSTKSAQGNMDAYFRKHRKYLTAERELHPRIARAERELEHLRHELATIEQGTWRPPAAPHPVGPRTAIPPGGKPSDPRRGPFRRFTSTDGLPIFVGRNARENDALTFGLAKSDDLWLHARGTPGSHVVVRLEKGMDPPPDTIRDAATLALLYSDLKKSGKGDVIYTRRKWVKKAKGQAAGAVTVTQEKSLHVSLDKKRLEELRQRTPQEAPG
ncbi:MAG: NFACT family protein [Nitrospiraceae bacterium]|nr:NFACT family protein [Nitrospiraceae bacterium]